MTRNGCLGCQDRHIGCHGKCKKYIEWKKEWDKEEQLKRAGRKNYSDYFYHKGRQKQR